MTQYDDVRSRPIFEQRVAAASAVQSLRYRAAYDELRRVRPRLAAEAARLTAALEQRLILRRTA